MIVVLKSKNETESKLSCTIITARRRVGSLHIPASFRVFHSGTYLAKAQKQLVFLQNQQSTISSSSPVLIKQLTRVRYKFYNQFTSSWPKNNFCTGKKWKLIEGLAGKIVQQWQDISQLNKLSFRTEASRIKIRLLSTQKRRGTLENCTPPATFKHLHPAAENKWKTNGMDMLKHYLLVELRALLHSKSIAELMPAHEIPGRQGTTTLVDIQSVQEV